MGRTVLFLLLLTQCAVLFAGGARNHKCSYHEDLGGKKRTYDCSDLGLSEVPGDIPVETTHLYLDRNNIQALPADAFKTSLRNLVFFSMTRNELRKVTPGALTNLPQLTELNFFHNKLALNDSLPPSVFNPLKFSLKTLDIRQNCPRESLGDCWYPGSISELQDVRELKMDLFRDKPLPHSFVSMDSLNSLVFVGGEKINFISQDMFQSVQAMNITSINLSGLGLRSIQQKALSYLNDLRILDLSDNPKLGISLPGICKSLHNTSLQILKLNNTGMEYEYGVSSRIQSALCGLDLRELFLDNNDITTLDPTFSKCFPKLKILSFSNNFISPKHELVFDILSLKRLTGLNISCQYTGPGCATNRNFSSVRSVREKRGAGIICAPGMSCPLFLPPNLQWLDISHNGLVNVDLPEVVLLRPSKLSDFKASFCGVQTALYPVFCPHGVVPEIVHFDVRRNNLECISPSFFLKCNWTSVKTILFGGNRLGDREGFACHSDPNDRFAFLRAPLEFEVFDLSSNKLDSMHNLTDLQNLEKLRRLDLSLNRFANFTLDLTTFSRLEYLDLSHNHIQCLSNETTLQLNDIQQQHSKTKLLKVDLSGNELQCNCFCLHFFEWMLRTDVMLVNHKNYSCKFDDNTIASLERLQNVFAKLQQKCLGSLWLQIAATFQTFVFVTITISSMTYRMRHDIKYMVLKMRQGQQKLNDDQRYTYSAFVSCSRVDAKYFIIKRLLPILESPETRLTFCVAQRNFLVGASIVDNIYKAITKSRKVIFVMSKDFLKSKWCVEELLMAHQVCH